MKKMCVGDLVDFVPASYVRIYRVSDECVPDNIYFGLGDSAPKDLWCAAVRYFYPSICIVGRDNVPCLSIVVI